LVEIVERLERRIAALEAENADVKRRLAAAGAENADLKRRLAAASKDSSTSSKPPFSDIVKPPRPPGHAGNGRIGGQPGHPRHERPPFEANQIDQICLHELLAHAPEVDAIFDDLVERLRTELPGFGRILAIDGKALWTHARPRKKDAPVPAADGRRDTDADFGRKTKHGQHDDGTAWEKVTKWFGYKLHLVVDAEYELPVAYEVTKASAGEAPQAHRLLDRLKERHPALLEACEAWTADKGYDDGKMIRRLWDGHEILPVIDIKEMWKEPDPTRVLPGHRRIVYDQHGAASRPPSMTLDGRPPASRPPSRPPPTPSATTENGDNANGSIARNVLTPSSAGA
jgi:hypothetical protein